MQRGRLQPSLRWSWDRRGARHACAAGERQEGSVCRHSQGAQNPCCECRNAKKRGCPRADIHETAGMLNAPRQRLRAACRCCASHRAPKVARRIERYCIEKESEVLMAGLQYGNSPELTAASIVKSGVATFVRFVHLNIGAVNKHLEHVELTHLRCP